MMIYYCKLEADIRIKGRYSVSFPDFYCCLSEGDNKEHALKMAKESLDCYIEGLVEHNDPIPEPIDRSTEGLYPVEVSADLVRRILESKVQKTSIRA